MSDAAPPAAERVVLRLREPRALGPGGLVALEDYARELTRARSAEALVGEGGAPGLLGVVLLAPREATPQALEDIEAFARDLAEREGSGLGWS